MSTIYLESSGLLQRVWVTSSALPFSAKSPCFLEFGRHHSSTAAVPDDYPTVLTSPIFWGLLLQLDCAFTNRHSMMTLLGWWFVFIRNKLQSRNGNCDTYLQAGIHKPLIHILRQEDLKSGSDLLLEGSLYKGNSKRKFSVKRPSRESKQFLNMKSSSLILNLQPLEATHPVSYTWVRERNALFLNPEPKKHVLNLKTLPKKHILSLNSEPVVWPWNQSYLCRWSTKLTNPREVKLIKSWARKLSGRTLSLRIPI